MLLFLNDARRDFLVEESPSLYFLKGVEMLLLNGIHQGAQRRGLPKRNQFRKFKVLD